MEGSILISLSPKGLSIVKVRFPISVEDLLVIQIWGITIIASFFPFSKIFLLLYIIVQQAFKIVLEPQ